MKSAWVVAVATVALGFGFSGAARGQEHQPSPSQGGTAKLEKRIAELERELATLRKELKELRRESQAQPKVTLIPVQYFTEHEVAYVLQEVYKDRLDFLAEALPKLKCVAVRADRKTAQEAREFVRQWEEGSRRAAKENLKIVSPREIDPDAVEEAVRQIQKHMSRKKK